MIRHVKDDSGEEALRQCRDAGHECTLEVVDDSKSMIRLHLLRSLFEGGANASDPHRRDGAFSQGRHDRSRLYRSWTSNSMDLARFFEGSSYDSIGSPALMTRAIAGTIENKPVFCLPGSPNAAKVRSWARVEGTSPRCFYREQQTVRVLKLSAKRSKTKKVPTMKTGVYPKKQVDFTKDVLELRF